MTPELRRRLSMRHPIHFLALGFGTGLLPKMPGTFGSLIALPLVYGLSLFPQAYYAFATLVACLVGIYLCGKTARDMGVHDHGAIVWDEVAGMLVSFIGIAVTPLSIVAGFVLFRFFDIVKPWPIRYVDKRISGGVGIMLDDILAGIMTCACLWVLF